MAMISRLSRCDRTRFDGGPSEHDGFYQPDEDSFSVPSFACDVSVGDSFADHGSSSTSCSRHIERCKLNDMVGKRKKNERFPHRRKHMQPYLEDGFSLSSLEIDIDTEDETILSDFRFIDGSSRFGNIDSIPSQPPGRNQRPNPAIGAFAETSSTSDHKRNHGQQSARRPTTLVNGHSPSENPMRVVQESLKQSRWCSGSDHLMEQVIGKALESHRRLIPLNQRLIDARGLVPPRRASMADFEEYKHHHGAKQNEFPMMTRRGSLPVSQQRWMVDGDGARIGSADRVPASPRRSFNNSSSHETQT